MEVKKVKKKLAISFIVLFSVFVGIFGLSAKQAFAKSITITPSVEIKGLPKSVTVGDSGKMTYQLNDILGVKMSGNVEFTNDSQDLLSLDNNGNWKALKPGKAQINIYPTLSKESFDALAKKYPNTKFPIPETLDYMEINIKAPNEGINRLYNANSGEHFYTKSNEEKNNLVTAGWKDEGTAWQAPSEGTPRLPCLQPQCG